MKFFSQSYSYDDSWPIVTLAFFLRYPNPYASHVLSCDVVSRSITPTGSLLTTRLILKRGAMPRWFPQGIVARAESWVVEETEVDPVARTVKCKTRNLDHVKVMQVEESVVFRSLSDGTTLQHTEAEIRSRFGWGLTKRIENHGLNRFKANVQKSREGVSMIVQLLRQSRLQPMGMGVSVDVPVSFIEPRSISTNAVGTIEHSGDDNHEPASHVNRPKNTWSQSLKSWFSPPRSN